MTPEQIDADLAHRQRLAEEGWAGTFLVEPLTALAGGLLGGTLIGLAVWRAMWRRLGP